MDKQEVLCNDIEIIFTDKIVSVKIIINRSILILSCDYFRKMLEFGPNKDKTSFAIEVPNAKIAKNIVESFKYSNKLPGTEMYTLPNSGKDEQCNPGWKDILETFQCRDFFCLEKDMAAFYNIVVPVEEFDSLLQILDECNIINDNGIVQMIKKNIPKNYDLKNFTTEFINEMILINNINIITANDRGIIKIINMHTGDLIKTIDCGMRTNNKIVISSNPNNKLIMCTDGSQEIKIWNYETNKLFNPKYFFPHICCIFTHDYKKLVTGNYKSIKTWDIATGAILGTIDDTTIINTLVFSFDGSKIVSGSIDETIKIWDYHKEQLIRTLGQHILGQHQDNIYQYQSLINCIVFSPDDSKIASTSNDCSIKIWNSKTGELLTTLKNKYHDIVLNVSFSPDGSKIVSVSNNKTIIIYNVKYGEILLTINTQDGNTHVSFSHDGLEIISADYNGDINIWDTVTGKLLRKFNEHKFGVIRSMVLVEDIDNSINEKLSYYHNQNKTA